MDGGTDLGFREVPYSTIYSTFEKMDLREDHLVV